MRVQVDNQPRMSRRLVLLLAVTCGAAAANLYYAQPLLDTIGQAFGVSDGVAGLLVTASQIGYATGLVLLVPLGDLLDRRRLVAVLLLFTAAAQALAAAAPTYAVLATTVAVAGVTSVVAQIIVPMASSLAADHERGQVVGAVMSGLLIGILLARTISGFVADLGGWRLVFALAAGVMVLLALVLIRALPTVRPAEILRYPALLRSVLMLIREEPVLRQRMVLGAVAMGCFSALWTPIAFLLSEVPYQYGDATIGLFGLAGLAGAAAAPIAGRLADRGYARRAMIVTLLVLPGSWGLLALGDSSLPALLAGIVLLDLAAQSLHINNQNAIYALRPEARSRLTTAYMATFFLGGTVMSAATAVVYDTIGWGGVCVLGAVTALFGFVFWAITERVIARRVAVQNTEDIR